jgi:biotin carboxyl carrier protein
MLMISAFRTLALGGIALSVLGLGAGAAGFHPWDNPDAVSSQEAAYSPEPFASAPLAEGQDAAALSPDLTHDEEPIPDDAPPVTVRTETNRPIEILMLVPEGTEVTRGQVICKFVTTDHRNNLATQRVATEHAKAEYSSAIKEREIAELAVREYLDGVFAQQKLAASGEVELAEAELELALARFERLEGAQEIKEVLETLELAEARIGVFRANLAAAEARIEVLRAELALKQAQKALEVLQTLTLEKQIKALENTVEKARFEENTKRAAFELEKEREDQIIRWINETQIRAPSDGVVIHAEGVKEGATLSPMRGGRLLLEIHPPRAEVEGSSDQTNRPFKIDPTR